MAKIHENIAEPDRAVLVGVNCTESDLDELSALCETCNIKTAARTIQNRNDIDVTYYVGRGKADEIKQLAETNNCTAAVFDVELSGSKVRNLEEVLGIPVLDRSKIILDIFARRAQSMEGKLQVELAQLKYNLPRLTGSGGLMSKMKNSVGMRGPGEKKLELDKRTIRDQITELEKKIAKVAGNRQIARRSAGQSGKTRVSIVGYTNSGKSTLLNTITKAGVTAEDKLFATLDPKTANVYLNTSDGKGVQILLTDTVGFINKLPHEFIRAFESTLDQAKNADLLLHVADISNSNYKHQIEVVNGVLKTIGADKVPVIMVYNKTDANPDFNLNEIEGNTKSAIRSQSVIISARKNLGLENLKQKIIEFVKKQC